MNPTETQMIVKHTFKVWVDRNEQMKMCFQFSQVSD